MLLNPRSAAAEICEDLKVKNIHDGDPRAFFICNNNHCFNQSTHYTFVKNDRCGCCGKQMDKQSGWTKETTKKVGVFVHDRANYIITDDLHVIPISLKSAFSLLKQLRIEDVSDLEERVVDVCTEKALDLLRRSLVSNCALTEICFPHACIGEQSAKHFTTIKKEIDNNEAEQKININVILNKKNNNVLYAEVGGDFLNQLVSFLTFPLGSVFKLLGGDMLAKGCINNLYYSAESLDIESLKIKNIHTTDPRSFFICKESDCLAQSTCYYTYANKSRCSRCGKLLTRSWEWVEETSDKGGIFVEDTINFMITDDLRVMPASLMSGYSLIEKLIIKDARNLEDKVIDFGTEEVLSLLKRSLVSKIPLTEVCLGEISVQASQNCSLMINEEMMENEPADREITLKLILDNKNNNVLCAEVGGDFINQLLSFLTFPLGSVLKLLSDNISVLGGCIGNLYSSVENMGLECLKSEDCRNILLTPKLSTFHGFEKQMLNVEEISSEKVSVSWGCPKCFVDNGYKPLLSAPCKHGVRKTEIIEQNPKSVKMMTCNGGAFVADYRRFMLADNLHVSPMSFISAIKTYETKFPIADLVEKDVCLDKAKALSLLSTMLISKTVLTDVFCLKPKRSRKSKSL